MLTPIIVPLNTIQIPLQSQEPNPGYHQYQIQTHYQVPDMQQLPLSDPRGLNHIPLGLFPPRASKPASGKYGDETASNGAAGTDDGKPEQSNGTSGKSLVIANKHYLSTWTKFYSVTFLIQIEMRQIPIELRQFPIDPMRGMRPMAQEPRQEPQISVMYQQAEQVPNAYNQEQGPAMMPPLPLPQAQPQVHDQRIRQPVMITQTEQRPPVAPQVAPEKPPSPFQGIPIEIRRIIQQVPLEIKNIIQHITGEARPFLVQVPEGARREVSASRSKREVVVRRRRGNFL